MYLESLFLKLKIKHHILIIGKTRAVSFEYRLYLKNHKNIIRK